MKLRQILILITGILFCILCCDLMLPHTSPPMPFAETLSEPKMDAGIIIICLPIMALAIWASRPSKKK